MPDANTLWDFREALIAAGALDDLFDRLDRAITAAGYLPRGGQIVDASLVAAPRQRNTDGEKAAIKEGKSAAEIWPDKPERRARRTSMAAGRSNIPRRRPVRRHEAGRYRDPGLGLQVPHLDRPDAWAAPPPGRHRCRPA